jgi:hypothetical protein
VVIETLMVFFAQGMSDDWYTFVEATTVGSIMNPGMYPAQVSAPSPIRNGVGLVKKSAWIVRANEDCAYSRFRYINSKVLALLASSPALLLAKIITILLVVVEYSTVIEFWSKGAGDSSETAMVPWSR